MTYLSDYDILKRVSTRIPNNIQNPYEAYADYFREKRHPVVSPKIFGVMIAFTIINLITILLCIFWIVLPILTSAKRRTKYLWLTQTTYLQSETRPCLVPNSVLTVALAQVLSTLACVVYTILDYVRLKGDHSLGTFLAIWIQLVWLLEFYAAWISCWSAFCTFLSSPTHLVSISSRTRRFFNPRLLNYIFVAFPVTVTVIALAWMTEIKIVAEVEKEHYDNVLQYLDLMQLLWKPGTKLDLLDSPTFVRMSLKKISSWRAFVTMRRWNFYSWAMIMTVTFLFHSSAAILLINLLRTCSTKLKEVDFSKTKVERYKDDEDKYDSLSVSDVTTLDALSLEGSMKRGHRYILGHSILVNLASCYTASLTYALGVYAKQTINHPEWRSLASWLYLVSGAIVTISMLLQSWRIFTDLDVIIPAMVQTDSRASWITVPDRDNSRDSVDDVGFDELVVGPTVQRAHVAVRHQPVLVVRKAF
ncbi:hypothetical protein CROQUDRAFT_608919 [Cronartium quercuum f. sp. fusiforme G11]|uniref:Uncharacterized protein n=1 Tax=Cronartium quercuum f. sp. fusiforme G11 TaxID=708437 RepID=A0A9P6NJK2_9BASI|nr:hypothetical protein CROQUDRAFT_608919 [Cronartium quercuum f. sp. fusiforme G11]